MTIPILTSTRCKPEDVLQSIMGTQPPNSKTRVVTEALRYAILTARNSILLDAILRWAAINDLVFEIVKIIALEWDGDRYIAGVCKAANRWAASADYDYYPTI